MHARSSPSASMPSAPLGPGPFFDGAALRAAKDRAAAGAALSTPFAEIVIWLAVSASLGTATMLTIEALARMGASCGVA